MSWLKRDSHLWGAPPAEMFTLTVRFVLKHVCVTSSPREEARTKKNYLASICHAITDPPVTKVRL